MVRRACLVLALTLVASCRSAAPLTPSASPAQPSPAPTVSAADADSIRWVRDSAEYQAGVVQAYRVATADVEGQARDRAAGSWAVILDADETIISNLTYQVERARLGQGYSPESWNVWVQRREATPLPGAAAFLARVRALGGRMRWSTTACNRSVPTRRPCSSATRWCTTRCSAGPM